jgi:hypothetical protein
MTIEIANALTPASGHSLIAATVSSCGIADLAELPHDKSKRSIERLAARDIFQLPQ